LTTFQASALYFISIMGNLVEFFCYFIIISTFSANFLFFLKKYIISKKIAM